MDDKDLKKHVLITIIGAMRDRDAAAVKPENEPEQTGLFDALTKKKETDQIKAESDKVKAPQRGLNDKDKQAPQPTPRAEEDTEGFADALKKRFARR